MELRNIFNGIYFFRYCAFKSDYTSYEKESYVSLSTYKHKILSLKIKRNVFLNYY